MIEKNETYSVKVLNASFESLQNIIPLLIVAWIRIQVTVVATGGNTCYQDAMMKANKCDALHNYTSIDVK